MDDKLASSSVSNFPRVIQFCYDTSTLTEDTKANRWSAKCVHCKVVITDTRGTTSSFNRYHVTVVTLLERFFIQQDIGLRMFTEFGLYGNPCPSPMPTLILPLTLTVTLTLTPHTSIDTDFIGSSHNIACPILVGVLCWYVRHACCVF